MKLRKLILSSFLVAALPLWAKSESKQPDSYAYTRGVEAYHEEKYKDALDWFKRELSEHPDNGYAYIYISGLRYGNQKAPLLLGQSVLERLGKIEIDNHGMKLVITHKVTK